MKKQNENLTAFGDYQLKQQLIAFLTRNINKISVKDLMEIVLELQESMEQTDGED